MPTRQASPAEVATAAREGKASAYAKAPARQGLEGSVVLGQPWLELWQA